MGSHFLSMRFWQRDTSRRGDRFASTQLLAPSSEKTTAAPISVGTWGQLPRLPRASGRTTLASSNPQVGWGALGNVKAARNLWAQSHCGCGHCRTWRGVGAGQGMVCWLHGFYGFPAEGGVSWSISYWSGSQNVPSPRTVNLQCGCRVNLVIAHTCFQMSMFSCVLASHFCGYQHHSLPVRHRCQHQELHSSPRLAVEDREMNAVNLSLHHLQEKNYALAWVSLYVHRLNSVLVLFTASTTQTTTVQSCTIPWGKEVLLCCPELTQSFLFHYQHSRFTFCQAMPHPTTCFSKPVGMMA